MQNTPNADNRLVPVLQANGKIDFLPANQMIPVADQNGIITYTTAASVQYTGQIEQVMPNGMTQLIQPVGYTQQRSEANIIPPAYGEEAYYNNQQVNNLQSAQQQIITPSYQTTQNDLTPVIAPVTAPAVECKSLFRKQCNRDGLTLLLYTLISGTVSLILLVCTMMPTLFDIFSNHSVASDSFSDVMQAIASSSWYENIYGWTLLSGAIGAILASTIPFFGNAKRSGFKALSVLGKGKYVPGVIWRGAVLGIGASITWSLVYNIITILLSDIGAEDAGSSLEFPINGLWTRIIYVVYVCVIAPIFEEFMFRGVLLKGLSKYGMGFSVATTAILFGLLHGNLQQTPFAAAIGVMLAYVAIRTGNIWSSVVIHCIINSFSTISSLLYFSCTTELQQTILSLGLLVIELGCIVGSIAILIVQSKRNKIIWAAADSERNSILLPRVNTAVKCKFLNMLIQPCMLIFIIVELISIITLISVISN